MPSVSISLNPDKPEEIQELEVELNQTIFDECEQKGIKLPHGCLAGSCGSCRIEVIEGSELLKPPSLIEQNTIDALKEEMIERYGEEFITGKEIRLSCRTRLINDGNVSFRPIK
ncbi:MAG: hypothetical protein CME70_08565 [Halobacteriovorax sp.]|nr:hypothetical protein [Halobacteriovorax sp.]|tara:strand:+ start:130649 stop:130990 length:342 start_codon:yes stop_codon:yes gene_type:complete